MDRAVDFLMYGVPEGGSAPMGFSPYNLDMGDMMGMGGDDDEGDVEDESGPIEGLEGSPQIDQLRAAIQADPSVLNQMLAGLQTTNPALAALIQQNPMGFLSMLMGGGAAGGPAAGGESDLSPEEEKAIERLMEYGFSEDDAYEAYIACD